MKNNIQGEQKETLVENLPNGWTLCRLGDVMRLKNGYAFKSKDYSSEGIPLVRISDINNGKVTLEKSEHIPDDKTNIDFIIQQGDLLIAMSGATTGKTGIYNGSQPCLQNQRVGNFKIISEDAVNKKYRNYYVASLRKEIEKAAYGGAQPNISAKGIEAFDFPLAPLNEQKRIVAEIEKQFSRLDEAVDNLKRVKVNLKRYKASVLKAAVEGKLTEEWRKKHPDVEPADKLLQRILAERSKKWEEAELAKMKAKGKEPKDDKWKKKYKAPVGPSKQNIDNLPNDWVIVTLDQVSGINPRIDKKGIPEYLEVSFVPMPEVGAENGYINVKNTRPFAEVKKGFTNFLEGDVLFAKITPCMENGKMVVVPKLSNGYGFGSTEFHVIRPFYGVNPYFIYYLVSNLSFRKEAAHRMTGAVGQKRVPVSFLIETVMSLPPIKEQDQIIREVQRRISIIDGVDSMIEISLKHADRLRQSILKKAFSGELVPQDAGDEPVEKLLNRILSKQDKAGKNLQKKGER